MKVNVIFNDNEELHEECIKEFNHIYNKIIERVYEDYVKGLL